MGNLKQIATFGMDQDDRGSLFIPQAFQERNRRTFQALVPVSGPAPTLEGELLRAVNRINYRHYNDGDYWYRGYGTETAGPAATFLEQHAPGEIRAKVLHALRRSDGQVGNLYRVAIFQLAGSVLDYVEARQSRGKLTPNDGLDMLACESKYRYEDDQEDESDE